MMETSCRLDYRITSLLSIFKREFDESEKGEGLRRGGVRGIDLEHIGKVRHGTARPVEE